MPQCLYTGLALCIADLSNDALGYIYTKCVSRNATLAAPAPKYVILYAPQCTNYGASG